MIDRRTQRSLARDPHDDAGLLLVERAFPALGTGIADLMQWVRNFDSLGPAIRLGSVSPVAFGGRFSVALTVRVGVFRALPANRGGVDFSYFELSCVE